MRRWAHVRESEIERARAEGGEVARVGVVVSWGGEKKHGQRMGTSGGLEGARGCSIAFSPMLTRIDPRKEFMNARTADFM